MATRAARFSKHQQSVLVRLQHRHVMTTRAISRPTTVVLARAALIVRVDEDDGPVLPEHRWRLTHLGRDVAQMVWRGVRRATVLPASRR